MVRRPRSAAREEIHRIYSPPGSNRLMVLGFQPENTHSEVVSMFASLVHQLCGV